MPWNQYNRRRYEGPERSSEMGALINVLGSCAYQNRDHLVYDRMIVHEKELKEREPMVMHIRNSKPIVPAIKSTKPTKAITMQFPVSSGEQHREQPLDVSSIISKGLNDMGKLQGLIYNSQKKMICWASSTYLPGQFTGSTGANILKPNELTSGRQLWTRKNQLTATKPVTGGMGMQLLQKMGWKPGEGLGPEKKGALQPLLLDIKLNKRGLMAQGENRTIMVREPNSTNNTKITIARLDIENKHPVCLLNELTSKRKWSSPVYTLACESGPSHSPMFLFSVSINGESFTPSRSSNTKKEAKLLAAKYCLRQIGILPPD